MLTHPLSSRITSRFLVAVIFIGLGFLTAACNSLEQPREAIRAALMQQTSDTGTLGTQREAWERSSAQVPIPRGVKVVAQVAGNVPGLMVLPNDYRPGELIIHVHGGGFTMGSPVTHRMFASQLALRTRTAVLLPDYRLAPEHPFPAAKDDVIETYRWALQHGYAPSDISFVGDSAGAHIVLTSMLALPTKMLPRPRAVVLVSPWVDLTMSGASITEVHDDPLVTLADLRICADRYLRGMAPDHPDVSPLGSDLSVLSPLLVHVGSDEILLSDARRLVQSARNSGVTSTLKEWPELWHVFHAWAPELPDASEALAEIASFIATTSLKARR